MIIRPNYILRQVMDYYIVLGIGNEAYTPNEIMSLNETGAFLWEILKNGATSEELVSNLVREYEVDEPTAVKDVDAFLTQLRRKELIAE